MGEFHRSPLEQPVHIPVELLHIDGAEALKVGLAVFIQRCLDAVFEVIVCRNGVRVQSAGGELGGEPVRKGGLARRRRACDHDEANVRALGDILCNIADLFFHHGFCGQDQLGEFSPANGFI